MREKILERSAALRIGAIRIEAARRRVVKIVRIASVLEDLFLAVKLLAQLPV